MNQSVRNALLAGAVVLAGIGVTGAAMQPGQQTHAHSPDQKPHGHGRGGQRFLSEYDLNHDGKVTRDEFNNWFPHLSPDGRRMVFLTYDRDVKGFVEQAFHDVPRVPLYQPYLNVAMQKNMSGYRYWFHRRLDYRSLAKG